MENVPRVLYRLYPRLWSEPELNIPILIYFQHIFESEPIYESIAYNIFLHFYLKMDLYHFKLEKIYVLIWESLKNSSELLDLGNRVHEPNLKAESSFKPQTKTSALFFLCFIAALIKQETIFA